MGSDTPVCPECGSKIVRSGPYFNILGELNHMKVAEAADKFYQNRDQYRDDTVRVFRCGNKVVVNNAEQ
jgi:hypothetical protein